MSAFANRLSRIGMVAALLHLGILGYTTHLILSHAARDWQMYWMLFLALDFPVSLGVLPVSWLVPPSSAGPLPDLTNFWWPLAYHGLIGTGWWYIVGLAIERRVWRREAAEQPVGTPDEPTAHP